MVIWLTLNDRAMALCDSPFSLRAKASARWAGVSFRGRPIRFVDRARPSAVRVKIISRSTSATPPRTARNSRPVLLVVSAMGCERERKWPPASSTRLTMPKRSKTDRARALDPGDYQLITRSNSLEQAHQLLAICPRPVIFSLKMSSQPAAFSCSSCDSSVWPTVLTRA